MRTASLLENPEAVVESLLAELRDGHRTPEVVPPGLKDLELWDDESLEQLLQLLHQYNRSGRLSDRDLHSLCLMLERSARSSLADDRDATVELDVPVLAALQPAGAGRSAKEVELGRGSVLRDRYVLDEVVGSGGMSIVFRARDLRRDADDADGMSMIAIKLLRPELRASRTANARLKREFRQTHALQHPGIVRMFDLDCDGDTWFITMELLVGTTLEARLKQLPSAPFDQAEVMRIAAECADVIAFAHRQGLLHGDFKPGNVFLQDGGGVKVLDFGTAPAAPQPAVGASSDRGPVPRAATRAYASPEVLAGEAPEPRDDVFSLACVVYESLSGRHPFGRLPASKARDLALAVTALPQLSSAQNGALTSGLAWSRAARPATVQEFMRVLTVFAVDAPPQTAVEGRSRKEHLRWGWPAALVATMLLLIAVWQFSGTHPDVGTLAVERDAAISPPAPPTDSPPIVSAPENVTGHSDEPPAPAPAITEAAVSAKAPAPSEAVSQPLPAPARARSTGLVLERERPRVAADSGSIVVSEGTPAAVILLRRQANLAGTVLVSWRLSNGSARVQEDFEGPATGTTRFLPGQATRAVYVPLVNDSLVENEESFSLWLSSPAAVIGPTGNVMITIVDDDR